MAKINYSYVEFYKPVFSGGKNFGDKVRAGGEHGVELWYDTDLRFMCMKYKGKESHFDGFHSADVASDSTQAPKAQKAPKA